MLRALPEQVRASIGTHLQGSNRLAYQVVGGVRASGLNLLEPARKRGAAIGCEGVHDAFRPAVLGDLGDFDVTVPLESSQRRVDLSEEEMLARLRRTLMKEGRLSPAIINKTIGLPCHQVYIVLTGCRYQQVVEYGLVADIQSYGDN